MHEEGYCAQRRDRHLASFQLLEMLLLLPSLHRGAASSSRHMGSAAARHHVQQLPEPGLYQESEQPNPREDSRRRKRKGTLHPPLVKQWVCLQGDESMWDKGAEQALRAPSQREASH